MHQSKFTISKLVAILGGIYMLFQGIVRIFSYDLNAILVGLLGIFLACLVVVSTGIFKIKRKIPWHWSYLLIIGIITIWVCWISAIIILIAAILLYYKY